VKKREELMKIEEERLERSKELMRMGKKLKEKSERLMELSRRLVRQGGNLVVKNNKSLEMSELPPSSRNVMSWDEIK
jgi:hypothetical protein